MLFVANDVSRLFIVQSATGLMNYINVIAATILTFSRIVAIVMIVLGVSILTTSSTAS